MCTTQVYQKGKYFYQMESLNWLILTLDPVQRKQLVGSEITFYFPTMLAVCIGLAPVCPPKNIFGLAQLQLGVSSEKKDDLKTFVK